MSLNLFSQFNPVSFNSKELLWLYFMMIVCLIPLKIWYPSPLSEFLNKNFPLEIIMQLKSLCKPFNYMNLIIPMITFMLILLANLLGLMPYTLSSTSHPSVNLPLALTIWLAVMLIKSKSFTNMLSHLIPPSTPYMLIPFMTLIESISLLIQPITLSIRLTANIMAGHVILTLLSSSPTYMTLYLLPATMILYIMEIGVAFIQSYVFSMLITLYMN